MKITSCPIFILLQLYFQPFLFVDDISYNGEIISPEILEYTKAMCDLAYSFNTNNY